MAKIVQSNIPEILSSFDRNLLSIPILDFRDSIRKIDPLWKYYKKYLSNKRDGMNGCEKLKQKELEFIELYERIKIKEKELEGQKEHFTQRPFYHFRNIDKKDEQLLLRLMLKRKIPQL